MLSLFADPGAPFRLIVPALIGVALIGGLALNGGHLPAVQAAMLALTGLSLAVLACAPRDHLARYGGGAAWAVPIGIALLIAGAGALPFPESALRWIAPGRVIGDGLSASATAGWATTLDGLTPWLLGAAVLAGIAAWAPRREQHIEHAAAWGLLGLALIVLLHRIVLPDRPFGLLPVATTAYGGWAPLINPNFNATVALALIPLATLGAAHVGDARRPTTWLLAAGAACGIAVVIATRSTGAAGALALMGVFGVLRWALRDRTAWRRAISVAILAVALPIGMTVERVFGEEASVALRLDQWWRTARLGGEHWLFGVGPGGYTSTYPAYQNPFRPTRFDHVHSDLLEWAVELGALGGVALVAALLLWRLRPRSWRSRATAIELGLLGVLIHAAVDFPLHLPAIAMLAVVLLGWRLAAYERAPRWPIGASRIALAALAVGCVLGSVWQGGRAWIDAAHHRAATDEEEAGLARLATWAPWRPEPAAAHARLLALDPARRAEAREAALALAADFPRDPTAQWQAGAALARIGELDAAIPPLERAAARHAADSRAPALLSRIAEKRGDREAAIDWWRRALGSYPYNAAVRDRPFDRALDLQPLGIWWVDALDDGAEPFLLVQLAQALNRRGDPITAWIALQEAVRRKPSFATLPEIGRTLLILDRTDEAIAQLAEAAAPYPVPALRYRAQALRQAGRLDEARREARAALFHEPDRPETALLLLAITREHAGVTAVITEADTLHEGAARRHPRVARDVADAAVEAHRWAACVRWLSTIAAPTASDQERLATCLERCVDCREPSR